jgi:general secretion pathway protein L
MTGLGAVSNGASAWMDAAAAAIVEAAGRVARPRKVKAVETEGGGLALSAADGRVTELPMAQGQPAGPAPDSAARLLRASRVELQLRPDRVLFRPLELPQRAAEFLQGVVRSQIDRLTPWPAEEAVFGCSEPTALGSDRIVVMVAATARAHVRQYTSVLAELGAGSITVSVDGQDTTGQPVRIRLTEERTRTTLDVGRVRRALVAVMILAMLATAVSVGGAAVIEAGLADRQAELARRITERRLALRVGSGTGAATTALGRLEQRKHETPSSVVVIEVLSQILPDHTYVTELRMEGDKLRLSGLTRDAPALIRLMEESPHFTRATFFAPTTRAPSDPGERFHIEVQIQPVFPPRS